MLKKTIKILEYSRIFSLPMTILSWLIVFTYSAIDSGNILYGLLSFLGIGLVHLATNLIDDFFDYKYLIKMVNFNKEEYLKNSQKTKCRYLISGQITESNILRVISAYLLTALAIGGFLYIKCGTGVLYYMLAGGIIAILYPLLSRICLSEIAVALAYGPILFGGVYYVMTGANSWEVFVLSIPSTIITVVLLYIHTIMDYEFDLNEGKKTIANRFNSELEALVVLKVLLVSAYIGVIILCITDITDWQVCLTFLTIPLAVDLYKSLAIYGSNRNEEPERCWYHRPMENLDKLREKGESSFMFRMYQSRNLMIYFSILFIIGILFSLAL